MSHPMPFHPQPKPETRERVKGRKARQESKVKRYVRSMCVDRDGACRLGARFEADDWNAYANVSACDGRSEWAHLRGHRRSQTRGQDPNRRHNTMHSLMLCKKHHDMEEAGKMRVRYWTDEGCDGPLMFYIRPRY